MRWLDYLLDRWNRDGKDDDKQKVRTIWFYPWKYHSKEDVWRGLISEVIIKSIDVKEPNVAKLTNAVKQFGLFLGRSFVHTVAGMTLKAKTPDGTLEANANLAGIKDILKEYREVSHPERAYMNDFENSLKEWVKDSLDPNERMVVFIDDLDRCMPDVALEVLEALKLYLNIDKLIFVVGVDKKVIDELVKQYCEKLGLRKELSGNYLAKMFQVEVELSPGEQQIEDYLEEQMKDIGYTVGGLTDDERDIFRKLILRFGGRNPREIKRLVNSAVMAGAGALMVGGTAADDGTKYTFGQGMQVFFVRRILQQEKYALEHLVGSRVGDRFFGEWSGIVCGDNGDTDMPRTVSFPPSFIDHQSKFSDGNDYDGGKKSLDDTDLTFAHEDYRPLLRDRELCRFYRLLSDRDLGELMQITYPADTKGIGAALGDGNDFDIVRDAIAEQLDKAPDELTRDDYEGLTLLDLSSSTISSLAALKELTQLQELVLSDTQVSDLAPLKGLTQLRELWLNKTQVSDLAPLKGLTQLRELLFDDTQVSDLAPLKVLTDLRKLWFDGTQVSDLAPLKGLTQLQELTFVRTQVSDLAPLAGLTQLRKLWLNKTQVSDLAPLKGLTELQELRSSNTQVSDLAPLKGLTQLQELTFTNTQVSDLAPLKDLTELRKLTLTNTGVSDLAPLKGLTQLRELYINHTEVPASSVEALESAIPALDIYFEES